MAHLLSEQEVVEFSKIFVSFDKDGDGHIRKVELKSAMAKIGHNASEAELASLLAEADTDGDGAINHAEFLELMAKKLKEPTTDEELTRAFQVFDTNGDGRISQEEMFLVMNNLGLKLSTAETEKLLRNHDVNKDGHIDYKEFVKMMKSN
ncbi:calmodulin-like [Saccoglossus kowalevskii]|uniref:Calmodulin-like n=1 Tax=Saccoglossus kowalevskii TaxID=10224 RepID=A0ABM0GWH0_SACKO|nr:PREDICTED: calmodulin-like [Saccoglossus kowalevskii]